MECPVCDRKLRTEGSLKQHCRDSHPKTYCLRCERPFANRESLRQHISSSSNHYRCEHCPHKPDFASSTALEKHQENSHELCKPCDRSFNTPESLEQHDIAVHNLCKDCGNFFDTEHNLQNHQRTHAAKLIPCPGCSRSFDKESAMVLHLEAGTCSSGTTADIVDDLAHQCYQSGHYLSNDGEYDFSCPDCETLFVWMSGLLQHAESNACEVSLSKDSPLGKFMHFLRLRVQS
ncbi:unnamed protein product [Clonostachys rosea f. rosea IK726]|uniref:C2H2-type domain-containing protein n=2 Tax=Bionectria ochroleuca TaxID=29856 RepID=A0A0B7KSD0_BIOOC|nr:unnamed protein product [Clonostachys rosea f. rosea IK726]